jgi:UDPglucose 6-dehydrogenase
MKIAVIGAGYVGLTISVCWARRGHHVVCVEKDQTRLAAVREGRPPFFEPDLPDLLAAVLDEGTFRVTDGLAEAVEGAEVIFIAVGTPSGPDGDPDLSAIDEVARTLAERGLRGPVVAIKSTIPIGTTDRVAEMLAGGGRTTPHVAHTPEFLSEGTAVADFTHPYRVVIGTRSRTAGRVLSGLYQPLGCPILVTDPCTSEMIKYASNAFLATKISFINQIAALCEHTGADVTTVAAGMGLDPRVGPYFLRAGIGFGGSCLPKDVRALEAASRTFGISPALFSAVLETNETRRGEFVERVRHTLGGLAGRSVAVFGLAFKGGTSDVRESPALDIAERLLAGGAQVRAFDPVAEGEAVRLLPALAVCPDPYEAAEGAEALVVLTDWPEFTRLDWERLRRCVRRPVVLDGRGLPITDRATAAGFTYIGPASSSRGASGNSRTSLSSAIGDTRRVAGM